MGRRSWGIMEVLVEERERKGVVVVALAIGELGGATMERERE